MAVVAPSASRDPRRLVTTSVIAVATVGDFLFRCLDRFAGAGQDDTFITLLAADQLAEGRGLVTYNGVPGEIGSSLLHVVVLAALRLAHVPDLYLANKLLGLACGALVLLLIVVYSPRLFGNAGSWAPYLGGVAAALTSCSPSYLFWTMGGLETPLVALLLTGLAIALARRHRPRPLVIGLLLALISLARPEGFLFLGVGVAAGVLRRQPLRWLLTAVAVPAALSVLVASLRWWHSGAAVPLPVLAKSNAEAPFERVAEGWQYLLAFCSESRLNALLLASFSALLVVLSRAWLLHRSKRAAERPDLVAGIAVVSTIAPQLVAVVIAGGDWMVFYRFVVPVIPLLSVSLAQLWLAGASQLPARHIPVVLGFGLVTTLMAALHWGPEEQGNGHSPHVPNPCDQRSIASLFNPKLGRSLGERIRQLNRPFVRDTTELDPFLQGPLRGLIELKPRLSIATYQMGFLPYRLRELGLDRVQLIDTVGITDPEIARLAEERATWGIRRGIEPAYFLRPDDPKPLPAAVAQRNPDLVYVLHTDEKVIQRLAHWGWDLAWNKPEAKIFLRHDLWTRFMATRSGNER